MSDSVLLALSAAYREDPSDENAHRLAAHVSRLEAPTTRKVLISPGYGAGFSTWGPLDKQKRKIMAEFLPLVEAVERGEGIDEAISLLEAAIGEEVYPGGVEDLRVVEVAGPYRIEEHDGWESLVTLGDML